MNFYQIDIFLTIKVSRDSLPLNLLKMHVLAGQALVAAVSVAALIDFRLILATKYIYWEEIMLKYPFQIYMISAFTLLSFM